MEYLIDKINEIGNPPRVSSGRTSLRGRHPHDHAPPLLRQSPTPGASSAPPTPEGAILF